MSPLFIWKNFSLSHKTHRGESSNEDSLQFLFLQLAVYWQVEVEFHFLMPKGTRIQSVQKVEHAGLCSYGHRRYPWCFCCQDRSQLGVEPHDKTLPVSWPWRQCPCVLELILCDYQFSISKWALRPQITSDTLKSCLPGFPCPCPGLILTPPHPIQSSWLEYGMCHSSGCFSALSLFLL